MSEQIKDTAYKEETKTAFVNFLSEVVNYVAVIATAIVTMSLSIFMDLINSTCNLLRTGFCTFLAKKLQKNLNYKYNYGTDKLETLSMLFCDALLIVGTGAVFTFAVYQLFKPSEVSDNIIVGVIFKGICVLVDLFLVLSDYKVYKKTKTKVAKSNYEAMLGSFGFDFAIFASVLCAFIFKGSAFVKYIEPVASVAIAVVIIVKAIQRIKNYIKEIINVTLDEEDQLKIAGVLARHFEKYERFYAVNSHKIGETVCVDFRLSFPDNTTYSEIISALGDFTKDLEAIFESCRVSIIFDDEVLN